MGWQWKVGYSVVIRLFALNLKKNIRNIPRIELSASVVLVVSDASCRLGESHAGHVAVFAAATDSS